MIASIADRFGLTLIAKWRFPRVHQTAYLKRLLTDFEVDCVFDVGANIGQYRDYLRAHVGYKGWIVSFEPHPDCFAACQQLLSTDPKWKIMPLALGSEGGVVDFHLAKDTQFSSFLQPDNSQTPQYAVSNIVEKTVSVQVRSLDDVYPPLKDELGFMRPFLKLDTQGFDLKVMAGGVISAGNFVGLQTEISNVPIYSEIPDFNETLSEFRRLRWQLATVFPSNPEQFPVMVDFDAYFVHASQN